MRLLKCVFLWLHLNKYVHTFVSHFTTTCFTLLACSSHLLQLIFNLYSYSSLGHSTFFFFLSLSLAHEGFAGLSWDFSASSVQSTGPDCFLPGARAQRHAPKLLLGPEGPTECLQPDRSQPGWEQRDESQRLWTDSGRPVSENGKSSVSFVLLFFINSETVEN